MNTKQEKLIRLSLTKRLVMSVILSAIVGSTAAVACTAPFANEPPLSGTKLPNGCLSNETYETFGNCSQDALQANGFTSFDVYWGAFGLKGTVNPTWVCKTRTTINGFKMQDVTLQSATITWINAPAGTSTAYNASNYAQCCQSGT